MRKLSVSTLVTLDGVIQDPGGFGETAQGGWGNPYFTADAQQAALERLRASDYFLIGRVTYELLRKAWGDTKGGAYLDRMNEIPKLVASTTLTGPLPWNATAISGDVAAEIAPAQAAVRRGHRGIRQRHAGAGTAAAQPDRRIPDCGAPDRARRRDAAFPPGRRERHSAADWHPHAGLRRGQPDLRAGAPGLGQDVLIAC